MISESYCADKTTAGMCNLNPCPEGYKCRDYLSERRYDCIKDEYVVPKWVRKQQLRKSRTHVALLGLKWSFENIL